MDALTFDDLPTTGGAGTKPLTFDDIEPVDQGGVLSSIGNIGRGIGERAATLGGGLVRGVATAVEPVGDWLQRNVGDFVQEPDGSITWRRLSEAEAAQPSSVLTTGQKTAGALEKTKFGYEQGTSWDDFKKSPIKEFIPFALEQGLVSAPDMLAAITNLPAYIAARTGEMGQERAKNNDLDNATVEDLLTVLPGAVAASALERLGARGILADTAVTAAKQLPKAVGKAALKEGVTEAGQELIEYGSTNIGTKEGFDPAQAGERMLAGAVGGAGFGGIARAATAGVEATTGRGLAPPADPAASTTPPADAPAAGVDAVPSGDSADILYGSDPIEAAPQIDATPETVVPQQEAVSRLQPPDPERLDSPRLTPEDRSSPLPNALIDDGKAIIDQALSPAPQATAETQQDAPAGVSMPQPAEVAPASSVGQTAVTFDDIPAAQPVTASDMVPAAMPAQAVGTGVSPIAPPAAVPPAASRPARLTPDGFPADRAGNVLKPRSLIEFLAERGGIQDQGGDLRVAGVRAGRESFIAGAGSLIRQGGMTLDQARKLAVEAGYLNDAGAASNRPSESYISDLLDAIGEDARSGRQLFSTADAAQAARWMEAQQARQDLDRYGSEEEFQVQEAMERALDEVVSLTDRGRADPFVVDIATVMAQKGVDFDTAATEVDRQYEDRFLAAARAGNVKTTDSLKDIPFFDEGGSATTARTVDDGNFPGDAEAEADAGAVYARGTGTGGPVDQGQGPVAKGGAEGSIGVGPQGGRVQADDGRGQPEARRQEVTTEPGADGKPQTVIPGAEQISQREQAQRKADAGLKPKVEQKDAGGLFGDDVNSPQLFDQPTPKATTKAAEETPKASEVQKPSVEGKRIDDEWSEFSKASGTLAIPRAEMPQIKAELRGAMVNFLNARGISHQEETVAADTLIPTQAEFSRKKVAKAKAYEGGDRSILVANDGHILDGHHQWMAKLEQGEEIKIIRLDAPIRRLLTAVAEMPSATTDGGATEQKPAGKIEDFGEKIAGARKDMVRDFRDSLDADIDFENEPLSKIFPQPDYEKLAESGVERRVLAVTALLRNEIPAKPRKGYKVDRWAKQVKLMRDFASSLMSGRLSTDEFRKRLLDAPGLSSLANTASMIEDMPLSKFPQAAKWRVRTGSYTMFEGVRFDGSTKLFTLTDEDGRMVRGKDGKVIATKTFEELKAQALPLMKAALSEDTPAPKKLTPVAVYSDRTSKTIFIGFKGKSGVIRLKSGFESAKEARAYITENADAIQAMIDEMRSGFSMRREVNRPREGEARRDGDVTPEQFQEAFGFRGVQFGNYVEDARRQFELNEAFDGLMDLAEVLGLPPKALSLNGTLGLAFGARGKGGLNSAKAHFEPDQIAINLTKAKGAGSLAHEWFHGLDNYFGRMDTSGNMAAMISKDKVRRGGTRDEIWDAWKAVGNSLDTGSYAKRMQKADDARSTPYWNTTVEKVARGFEKYVVDRLATKKATNDYLANIDENAGAYPTDKEMAEQGVTAALDSLFSTIETKVEDGGNVKMFQKTSGFSQDFADDIEAVTADLRKRMDKLGLSDVSLRMVPVIEGYAKGERFTADGSYFRGLIEVSLSAPDKVQTINHEAIHALKNLNAFSKTEWSLLAAKSKSDWIGRFGIDTAYDGSPEWIQVEEGVASAYAEWAMGRQTGGTFARMFQRIKDIITALGNALRGKGYDSVGMIFERVESGDVGSSRPLKQGDDAQGETRFQLTRDPSSTEERQDVMQGFIARGQPIDRAIRLPFEILGGISKDGTWKPGKKVNAKLENSGRLGLGFGGVIGAGVGGVFGGPVGAVVGGTVGSTAGAVLLRANISPNGRFGWMHSFAENARRGLVDRYGISEEYIAADQKRQAGQRQVMQKAQDILQVLQNASVGPQEAKVLQAVLTGENVTDADMMKVAAPIRAAIDELGAEAVSLGLISAESFERNRGSYLHRVYQKNEMDQGGIISWGAKFMQKKRVGIMGDQLKGRGLFWEVPRERLLRYSEATTAMKKSDARIGMLERKVDSLSDRRSKIEAEMEVLGREMASQMGRRIDVANRATVKKMVGDSRTTKPTSFQKGQVREQSVALTRVRDQIEQRMQQLDTIDGQIAEAQKRIDTLSDMLISQSEGQQITAGRKFIVVDKKDGGEGKTKQRIYLPADERIPARFTGPDWVNRGQWEVRSIGKDKITIWRDYTKEERTKMGEVLDARYTIAKTFMLMANDLSTGRFYKQVSENPDWAQKDQPATEWREAADYGRFWNDPNIGWVRVPDTTIANSGGKKRYGALAGMFVRAEIWRDLNEVDQMSKSGIWRTVLTQWKVNKTARSPVTHMNNIMSNMMFMDLGDVRMQDLVAGIKAFATGSSDYLEARDAGAFGSDMIAQEIRKEVLQPILDEIAKTGTDGKNPLLARMGVLGTVADKIWTWGKAADDRMLQAYQMEDEVFRMATYMRRRSLGDSVEVAARNAREQFLDYDIRAPWVNAARQSVLPFISYSYRAIPKLAENISNRPWKVAKYFAIAYAANMLAYMWDDGDDGEERERASLRDEEQGWTWLGVPRMLRMPYRDSDGMPVFLDIRRWIPSGDVFDTNQGQSAVPVPSPLQLGGPLLLAFEFALNKQAFTGNEITNDLTDTAGDKAEKVGDWLWKSWMPSAAWVPNSWYWEKIENAIKGAEDYTGRKYSLLEATMSSIGVKLKPQNVEDGLGWKQRAMEEVERALRTEARRLSRNRQRGLISESEFNKSMAELTEKFANLGDKAKDLGERAQKKPAN